MIQLLVKVHFRTDLSGIERWNVLDWTRQSSSSNKRALMCLNTERMKRQSRTEGQKTQKITSTKVELGCYLWIYFIKYLFFYFSNISFLHNFKCRWLLKPLFAPYLKLQEVQPLCTLLLLGWAYPDDFNNVLKGH